MRLRMYRWNGELVRETTTEAADVRSAAEAMYRSYYGDTGRRLTFDVRPEGTGLRETRNNMLFVAG